jgi:hypothetical protein
MRAVGPTEDGPSLLDAAGELSTQEPDAACTFAESQSNIDASEEETARNRETITATDAEQDRHVTAVRQTGRARPEELREKLGETPYELLILVKSPAQMLPYELMAEVFDWHILMGGRLTTTLLVCKRWTMVAYSIPRLWSKIFVTNYHPPSNLQGSVLCADLDDLRFVLSRSRSCPLQLELSFRFSVLTSHLRGSSSSTSLIRGPNIAANRTTAINMILNDQILRRCTSLVLGTNFLPSHHLNTTVLPLLSSIITLHPEIGGRELLFVNSLVNLSPALRHIHCTGVLSAENLGVGLWTKRIESYGCISPFNPCYLLHESPSLRRVEVSQDPLIPLTLPAVQILKWSIGTYSTLRRITAPLLHTLILRHSKLGSRAEHQSADSISFPNLRVAVHTWIHDPTVLYMFHTPVLEHLSIEYRSSYSSPAAIIKLLDGWVQMPRPKSLHLDCTFTDAYLVSVLRRLPWLEELKVAGNVVQGPFWEGMALSCNRGRQVSPSDEDATRMLVPNLKILLVNYPTAMLCLKLRRDREAEVAQLPYHLDNPSIFGELKVPQVLGVAAARKKAGCPLRTLACRFPGQGVKVLIGSLDGLPTRPKFVSLSALWCRYNVLTSADDRWGGVWQGIT